MSEAVFQIFSNALFGGAELIYAMLFVAFVRPFLPGRGRWIKLASVLAVYLILNSVCPYGSFILILTLVMLAVAKCLGLPKSLVFLLTLLYFNARISGGLLVQSPYFIMEQFFPQSSAMPERFLFYSSLLTMLLLLSHVVLLAVMLYAIQQRLRKQRLTLRRRELCYISLIPTAGILFGQLIARLLFEVKDGVLLQLYERHPAFLAVVPVLALLFYAGTYLTIVFQQGMVALQEEQSSRYVEQQQTQAIRARIHEAEQFYAHIRELKHEMRGHMTNIKSLARNGEYDSLVDYIVKMDENKSDFELTLQTGNPVTDVIVNDIRRRSLDLGIRFQLDFHYPELGAYDTFDMGIILQNLLQNAVEACEKVNEGARFIELSSKRKGRFFLIEVKNSFSGEVVFGPDGLPVTSKKEDVFLHGIGLANVRREAEKYMGELELNIQPQEFVVTVLLQERSVL